MIGTGEFIVEANGKKYGFKFGMYASAITEKESGFGIFEVFRRIFESPAESSLLVLNYMYGGAVAYAKSNKLPEPTPVEVGEWMDDMGIDQAMKVYTDSVTAFRDKSIKNKQAPQEETTQGRAVA